jgi:hypothetical protein
MLLLFDCSKKLNNSTYTNKNVEYPGIIPKPKKLHKVEIDNPT